jgi:hypothetical protein
MTFTRLLNGFAALAALTLIGGCAASNPCVLAGTTYSDGAASCQAGYAYRCDAGKWAWIGPGCNEPVSLARNERCVFGGVTYAEGSASCQDGTQYRCDAGEWRGVGTPCPAGGEPIRTVPGGRACMYGTTMVPNSSAVCQSGVTSLCRNGEWINLNTQCRESNLWIP